MGLTQRQITGIKEPGRYGDGRGLYLQVTPSGVRSWLLRYERAEDRPDRNSATRPDGKKRGRERWMGLGPLADFSLEEARERARKARQLLNDGVDPIDARNAERTKRVAEVAKATAREKTFEEVAQQYFKFHSPKWKNAKHRAQFLSTLKQYAYPVMSKLPVAHINKTLVLKAIQPIWESKNETASRVRGRIEAVLDFAKVNGWREGENPAAWAGNLIHALPAPGTFSQVKHHAALPFTDVFDFMTQLATCQGIGARALEVLIHTATRTGEIIGARWDEFDLEAKLWTIPPLRMKAKKEHRVPLSDRTIAILKALPHEADFVFPGGRKGVPISNMAMSELLKRMGRSKITVHGFRSTFRDWAAEQTSYPNHVVEMALAHVIGDKVEAAYRRGDLFAKRVRLMNDWTRHCMTKPTGKANNVILIRATA